MSCDRCGSHSAAAGEQAGAPAVDAHRAGNTGHGQQCPACGQFVSPSGGHTCPVTQPDGFSPQHLAVQIADILDYLENGEVDDALYVCEQMVGDTWWHAKAVEEFEAGDGREEVVPKGTVEYTLKRLADILVYLENDEVDDALYMCQQLAGEADDPPAYVSAPAADVHPKINYENELALIVAKLQDGQIGDAQYLARTLVTEAQIDVARREFHYDEEDDDEADIEPAPMTHRLQGEIAAMLVRMEEDYSDEALEMGEALTTPKQIADIRALVATESEDDDSVED